MGNKFFFLIFGVFYENAMTSTPMELVLIKFGHYNRKTPDKQLSSPSLFVRLKMIWILRNLICSGLNILFCGVFKLSTARALVCVCVCVCLCSSTVKASSVRKISETYFRARINNLVLWILVWVLLPSSFISVPENVIFHLQRRKLQWAGTEEKTIWYIGLR